MNNSANDIFALLLLSFVLIFLYAIPALLITIRLFMKAGRSGWAAIVPVYSYMVMSDIGKQPVWLGVTAGIVSIIPNFSSHRAITSILDIVAIAFYIFLITKMAKQYESKQSFWWLYVLLPIVAVFMVGKLKYIGGPTRVNKPAAASPAS